jgi:hypothetical protein
MQDRRVIRGAPGGRTPIEIVGEDRFDGAVGARADVDRPHGGGIEPLLPVGSSEPDDAETGAEACSGCARSSRIRSHNAAVAGPIVAASLRILSMVQPAWRR